MKILLLTFFLFLVDNLKAQVIDTVGNGTTETEYNYITKAYKTDMEEGRDVKSGYSMKLIHSQKLNSYEFEFYAFVRDQKKEVAAILAIAKYTGMIKLTNYFCIPIKNNELEQKYLKEVTNRTDPNMARFYAYVTSELLAKKWSADIK